MKHCSAIQDRWVLLGLMAWLLPACTGAAEQVFQPVAEVRGVWLTTTANDALASPADTAARK